LRLGASERIGIVSAALILVGGLLPWASMKVQPFGTAIRWGFEADGVMTMILSPMSLAVIAVSKRLVLKRAAIGSIGGFTALVALVNYRDLTTLHIEGASVEPGAGLLMSLIGGIGLLVSIVPMREHVEEPSPTQDFSNEPATSTQL